MSAAMASTSPLTLCDEPLAPPLRTKNLRTGNQAGYKKVLTPHNMLRASLPLRLTTGWIAED